MTEAGPRGVPGGLRRGLLAASAALPLVVLAPGSFRAAPDGWSLTGQISEQLSIATNPRLSSGPSDTITPQSTTRLSVTLVRESRRSRATLSGSVAPVVAEGADEDLLGILSPNLSGNLALQGKRIDIDLGLAASATSLTFADLLFALDPNGNPDPNNPTLLTGDAIQVNLAGNAGLAWAATPRDSVTLGTSLTRVDFVGSSAGLTPFTDLALDLGWTRSLSSRLDGSLDLSLGWFRAENPEQTRSLSLGLSGGLSHAVSSRLTLDATLGLSVSDTTEFPLGPGGLPRPGLPATNDFALGALGSLGLSYATPDVAFSLSLSQDLQPSTLGQIQNTTSLVVSASYAINAASTLDLSTRFQLQTPIGTAPGTISNATTGLRISPSYSYRLDRDTSLQLGYNFDLSNRSSGRDTISHTVFLSLSRSLNLLQ